MCGISGIVDARHPLPDRQTIGSVLGFLRHRGPDAQEAWSEYPTVLCHARLSIIDLSPTGAQPMHSPDGRWVLVYNGEIYNHLRIRAELESRWSFRGTSDTETLLAALVTWGPDAVSRLNGIYAFALWDRVQRELLLVRDPLGVKPLFWSHRDGALRFASEVKALFPEEGSRRLDYASMHEFMFFGAPLGASTLYRGVRQLLPGEVVRYRAEADALERWTAVSVESWVNAPAVRPVEHGPWVRDLLQSAVESQLMADVPVGVLLSGGLDSSTITAFASRLGQRRISTFSIGFADSPLGSELSKARVVAEHFGTDHHEEVVRAADVVDLIERTVEVYDGPFSDAANLPLLLLYGRLKGRFKVMLQGDGGDEVFAGYRRYLALRFLPVWQQLAPYTRQLQQFLERRAPTELRRLDRICVAMAKPDAAERMAYLLTVETNDPNPLQLLAPGLRAELRRHDPFERYRLVERMFSQLPPAERMLATDLKILLPDVFLTKVDRASMAHGIEARVPLLDLDLVRGVLPLSAAEKTGRLRAKALMRRAMKGLLPRAILEQEKAGFGVPYGEWLRTGLREKLRAILLDSDSVWADVFDRPALELCLKQHLQRERDFSFLLWKMMNLALWLRRAAIRLH